MASDSVELTKKIERFMQEGDLSQRIPLSNTALAGWRAYPVFGMGMGNFKHITPERVAAWREQIGASFEPKRYFFSSHAHSLYMNTLAERGLVGLSMILWVLAFWLYCLGKRFPGSGGAVDWMIWGGSFSAWFVTAAAGLLNTTLHTEHGLLSMLLLGLWLAHRPEKDLQQPK